MIWHFFEVWFLFLVVFAIGCWLGVLLYRGLAQGPLAGAQGAVADLVGDGIDQLKWRLGVGPDWRPAFRAAPAERNGHVQQDFETRDPHPNGLSTSSRAAEARDYDESWPEEPSWEVGADSDTAPEDFSYAAGEEFDQSPVDSDDAVMRPAILAAPRAGVPDNLRRIRGIGKRNEELLHGLGIFHFGQIAAWTPAEARWVASHLAFPDSIERDDWIGQAIVLASGGDTGYVDAAERRRRAAAESRES